MIKQYGSLVIVGLVSALVAVGVYHITVPAKEIVIREAASARYTNFAPASTHSIDAVNRSVPVSFENAAAAATPAVVHIQAVGYASGFSAFGRQKTNASTGSGVLVSEDGYVVTNRHVIEGAHELSVLLNNHRAYTATLVGSDPTTDLALLKIEGEQFPYISFGDSDSLQVGAWVLAVGNPFNLASTVTAGIVSAKGRSIDILEGIDRIESFIQTDAAINPGNSGGALVNVNGELVGINTAIVTKSGRYEGYSFAVPANLVRKVISDLRSYGSVQRGLLGVYIEEMTAERADERGLPDVIGVYVTRIRRGSGAADAGLRRGDVILSINGKAINTMPEMQEQMGRHHPGRQLKLQYHRDGALREALVLLKGPEDATSSLTAYDKGVLRNLGMELRDLQPQERKALGYKGVKVMSLYEKSLLEQTNMEPNFIITSLNNMPIRHVRDFIDKFETIKGDVLLKGYYPEYEGAYYYRFKLP